jgi:transcription elongation factor Elf1
MKKGITCQKCGRLYKVVIDDLAELRTTAQDSFRSYPCPHCGKRNEVAWPLDEELMATSSKEPAEKS